MKNEHVAVFLQILLSGLGLNETVIHLPQLTVKLSSTITRFVTRKALWRKLKVSLHLCSYGGH